MLGSFWGQDKYPAELHAALAPELRSLLQWSVPSEPDSQAQLLQKQRRAVTQRGKM